MICFRKLNKTINEKKYQEDVFVIGDDKEFIVVFIYAKNVRIF